MSLDDIRLREEIDLADRATEIRDELIPDLEDRIQLAGHKAADENLDDPDQSPQELREFRDKLEGQADACDRVVNEIGSGGECPFVLQELMGAEQSKLQDDVTEESIDMDFENEQVDGVPKDGYHRIRMLQLSVVEWPDGVGPAGTDTDRELKREVFCVGKLPGQVIDYLFRNAEALNDLGECDGVGNLEDYGVTVSPS